jgi:hypothetical protein
VERAKKKKLWDEKTCPSIFIFLPSFFPTRLHDQLLDASVIDSAKSKKVMEEMSKLEQEVIDINLQEPVIASVLGDENFSDPKSLSDRPELQFETHGFDTNWSNPRTNPNQSELELLKSYVEAVSASN